MALVWGQYWFKDTGNKTDKSVQPEYKREAVIEESKKLYCLNCKHLITDLDAAISIDGTQTHTFTNPGGYTYTIDCFHSAPGCQAIGDATEECTWFKGYAWQIAVCERCHEQLGWFYSNDKTFFGLISDRLTHIA